MPLVTAPAAFESRQRLRWFLSWIIRSRVLQYGTGCTSLSHPTLAARAVLGAVCLCFMTLIAPTVAQCDPPKGYALVWSQSFAQQKRLDPTVWRHEIGNGPPSNPGWGNGELEHYTADPANLFIEGGALHIRALLGEPPTSARIMTRPGQLPAYGYYEITARLPCGAGAWPAIWMLGEVGDWPARGEIDIVEWSARYFTHDEVQSALHAPAFHGGDALTARIPLEDACGKFHVYKLQWTRDIIRTAVDRDISSPQFEYRRPGNATHDTWPFDQPMQLILNVAVGGSLGGPLDGNTQSYEMLVTDIRVYRPPSDTQ